MLDAQQKQVRGRWGSWDLEFTGGVGAFSRCTHRNHKYQVTEDLRTNEERQCSTDLLGLGPFFFLFFYVLMCLTLVA